MRKQTTNIICKHHYFVNMFVHITMFAENKPGECTLQNY